MRIGIKMLNDVGKGVFVMNVGRIFDEEHKLDGQSCLCSLNLSHHQS